MVIRLRRSLSGRLNNQIATAKSLGLRRIGDTSTQPDNEATRGKIAKISHMIEILNQ
ncbi:MAG: 50S ribosomal protein L30 [Oscillospiraceae bacterium]|nr:50S ribosomal protein L30 [Oscillospiraceae bacterium]